jgi:hypothetical protein
MASSAEVLTALHDCAMRSRSARLSLGDALRRLREDGPVLACVVLALLHLQPLGLGPLFVIGGLALAALGFQVRRGARRAVLHPRLRSLSLGPGSWRVVAGLYERFLRVVRPFTRHRLPSWVEGEPGARRRGTLIVVAGLLIAVPWVAIPFNNALPALAVLFACLAHLERDGLMLVVSLGLNVLTALYFSAVGVALLFAGKAALRSLPILQGLAG